MIQLMDKLLKKVGLDLKLTPYRALATSPRDGLDCTEWDLFLLPSSIRSSSPFHSFLFFFLLFLSDPRLRWIRPVIDHSLFHPCTKSEFYHTLVPITSSQAQRPGTNPWYFCQVIRFGVVFLFFSLIHFAFSYAFLLSQLAIALSHIFLVSVIDILIIFSWPHKVCMIFSSPSPSLSFLSLSSLLFAVSR